MKLNNQVSAAVAVVDVVRLFPARWKKMSGGSNEYLFWKTGTLEPGHTHAAYAHQLGPGMKPWRI